MFLSLFLIFFVGVIGGILFEKIRIPKIIFYLILGILFGGGCLDLIDPSLEAISDNLRQIALIIILTRAGLALDFKSLVKNGRAAILMCFLPASLEIIGVTIFGPLLLNISYLEALLLGCVLGAVSPAIVVPRMLKMIDNEEGGDIPKVIMAGASCDDIFVIVIFYSVLNILKTSSTISFGNLIQIPSSIILGLVLGAILGIALIYIFKILKASSIIKVIAILGVSFLMVWFEAYIKPYISVSALLGVIVLSMIVSTKIDDVKEVKISYNHLWNAFEIILFVLVGTRVKLDLLFSLDGLKILFLVLIGLSFRTIGVLLCIIKKGYSLHEKVFFVVSYLPKATVQASIGAIALTEGLSCGNIILVASVIAIVFTAPLGAIASDFMQKKYFEKK